MTQTAAFRADITTPVRAFHTDSVPWRLYGKAKKRGWDPADIDFSDDARDWQDMEEPFRRLVLRLATSFMVGEEAVTLDILPFVRAIAASGRTEETMFLTTFVADEAKHTEVFRRWMDAVGIDEPVTDLLTPAYREIFEVEQPRVMNRLDDDRSPEAFLDAALTYNHFVEGVVAMTGYWAWKRVFESQGILPGIKEGIGSIQRDERRHIAYGTYVARRIIAAEPELWSFAAERMAHLRALGLRFIDEMARAIMGEMGLPVPEVDGLLSEAEVEVEEGGPEAMSMLVVDEFTSYGTTRLDRRLEAIGTARESSVEDVDRGTVEEDLEADLEAEAS